MIFYEVNGELQSIKGSFIRKMVVRGDLVPIPLTLEAEIRVDDGDNSFLKVGRVIYLANGDSLQILASSRTTSGKVQNGNVVDYLRITAVLDSVASACFASKKAIIKEKSTLSSIYRSSGCQVKSINGDFVLTSFSCMSGEAPTFGIARALQESAGVVGWKNSSLWMKPVRELFNQEPMKAVSIVGSQDIESEFLKRHEVPTFYSIDRDGQFIYGNRAKARKAIFIPNKDQATLRNMGVCLVLSRVVQIAYHENIAAGDLIKIDESTNYVVITFANIFVSGSDGEAPQQFTKLWLGSLYE